MQGEENQLVLKIDQNIVSANAKEIKEKLKESIPQESGTLVVDLGQVDQVDSIGVGVLIATFNSLKKEGKGFKLVNVDDNLYNLFQVMRLNKHFEIEGKN
ncbi:anti-sigma-factor antagonist [Desulfonatronospira thiodismutans ASO3-1]|uniref:Anti-sigma-factor antagonist n=1 Tax=Desulfonatronospira thiodismutans ASO3-1 TaxID=555779 RepID=D6SUE3_9BACT|nr:STAS domain-containing protein [Desulfonatronospira thiodismutans]EFI32923.1 anti-sigma-factor antagonist [Desulfonatronospira thiodismutans ASO3-1]